MERVSSFYEAQRMARVLFSDIVAYAGDQVRIGLEKDDLFDRLRSDIEQARVFYQSRVDESLPDRERIFNWALVDVLVAGNRKVATHIW
jgi:hypothetical protein